MSTDRFGVITTKNIITKDIIRDIRAYDGSLSDALTDIGSNECTLLIAEPIQVTSDLTIPENVTLKILKGCPIEIVAGVTLTINGYIEAGIYQIFSGDGSIAGSPKLIEAYLEWFGGGTGSKDDVNLGKQNMRALVNISLLLDTNSGGGGGIIKFLAGTYPIYKDEWISIENVSGITLQGSGKDKTILVDFSNENLENVYIHIFRRYSGDDLFVYDLTYDNSGYNNLGDPSLFDRGKLFTSWYYPDQEHYEIAREGYVSVERCKFVCNAQPFDIQYAKHVIVRDCEFVGSGHTIGDVVSLGAAEVDYAEICNNYVEEATRPEDKLGKQNSINVRVSQGVISNNWCKGSNYTSGILIERTANDYTREIVVCNNIVDITDTSEVNSAIYFHDVVNFICHDNIIVGNNNYTDIVNGINIGLSSLGGDIFNDYIHVHHNSIKGVDRAISISLDQYGSGNITVDHNNAQSITQFCRIANYNTAPSTQKNGRIVISDNSAYDIFGSSYCIFEVTTYGNELNLLEFRNNYFRCKDDFDTNTSIDRHFNFSFSGDKLPPPIFLQRNKVENSTVNKINLNQIKAFYSNNIPIILPLRKYIEFNDPIDLDSTSYIYTKIVALPKIIPLNSNRLPSAIILKAVFTYTEATSSDPGIPIIIDRYGDGRDPIYEYTTEASQPSGYSKTVTCDNFDWGFGTAYDNRECIRVRCSCNKIGTGELVVGLEYVEIDDI